MALARICSERNGETLGVHMVDRKHQSNSDEQNDKAKWFPGSVVYRIIPWENPGSPGSDGCRGAQTRQKCDTACATLLQQSHVGVPFEIGFHPNWHEFDMWHAELQAALSWRSNLVQFNVLAIFGTHFCEKDAGWRPSWPSAN